ncbi:aldehyde dehydrogenase [Antarcticibacterium arcticum]|uniref:Aldehyde dehydrogenase n=1 Tax=Antarcticibacterium arcticum TaxID=2585771 RepID=A0A5B8YFB0_9FLAO|nr:aldehyde dehydrogenase [Antarcticibacterium arcticum]QED36662.1 aldehyde dehydrogenase [Antarcticibacterium arcticum]
MENTSTTEIDRIHREHQNFFATHQTKNIDFKIDKLKKLKSTIDKYEGQILEALGKDLGKSEEEAYLTEKSIVTGEIEHHLKNLKRWAAPQKVSSALHLLPSSGKLLFEPLGQTLIIAPWNYPFQLLMAPLIGAISAGCCAILKPSENTQHIAAVMDRIIKETFEPNYIAMVHGDQETGAYLLEKRFDMIFFTGSTRVGKIVMKAAAEHLTPVILELGGKSPCIVDENANIEIAAKRIIWGKTINSGQTCIAPDYLLVHEKVKEELIENMQKHIESMYGRDPEESSYYPRIVNKDAFDRLSQLLEKTDGTIRHGGQKNREKLYISPTILDGITGDDELMKAEIFGPILPIMTFTSLDEAITQVNSAEKPLALYYFGNTEKGEMVLEKTSSGGACINDTLMHIANHNLPFGGVGNSGQGSYHGRESFLAFSNRRAVVTTPTWIDLKFKYAPFKYFEWIKKLM